MMEETVPMCLEELLKVDFDGRLYSVKEVVDFDGEKFDKFYQHYLQYYIDHIERSRLSPTSQNLSNNVESTQLWVILLSITTKRENKRLERKIDLLLKSR